MSTALAALSVGFCAIGALFFLAGTVGLLRFPDTFSRLHALTKADSLGLGFVAMGLALDSGSWAVSGKLGLIWLVALLAGASACYLIARHTDTDGNGGGP
jgi:multicomponent Na+:H+ antiporter subunit G